MFPDNFVRIVETSEDNSVTLRDKSATANRRCKVIYSYTQVNDDELTLAVGDVIEFLGEVEEGWWRGRLKNKTGVFPSNFVVAIEPSPIFASKRPPTMSTAQAAVKSAAPPTAANTVGGMVASALNSTKKTNRLSFHSSKEDLLSSTVVTTTTTTATSSEDMAPTLPPKPHREYCRVEFPYAPQNDDELELKVGDIITIISMELPDKGWWKGELRGKVGVFPDNFVKLMAPSEVSPLHDSQSHRTAKNINTNIPTAAPSSASASATTTATASTTVSNVSTSNSTSKVFIKKSGSNSSTQSSNRKDSFGSRDSLNDILSETGLQSGNVAAQRKSLENKNLDLSNAPDGSGSNRLLVKKFETKTVHSSSSNITTSSTAMSTNISTSELRKSIENLDEKLKTPPPVLTKKPTIPTKKSTTVTSVAGNLLSGLKQKVKNVENKLTTSASHDYADGIASSRMQSGSSGLPDLAPSGNVVMRRAATVDADTDFDRVERASILTDMRAGRVKAPKRRPPSAAMNIVGESNNNSVYVNGSGGSSGTEQHSTDDGKPQSSDDNSLSEEQQLIKPKPREWEKKKAPWMAELKASQVKKKTSPNIEPRTIGTESTNATGSTVAERTSKLLGDDTKISNSSSASSSSISSSTTTKVQSSSVTSSVMQQSMTVESSQQMHKKELNTTTTMDAMSKSMSNKLAAEIATTTTATTNDDVRTRPNSLSIRNRSISPSVNSTRSSASKSSASPATVNMADGNSEAPNNSNSIISAVSSTAAKTTIVNNHHAHTNNNAASTSTTTVHENNVATVSGKSSHDSARVQELEKRVDKLETIVNSQQRTIDELIRTLREETDRVKVLRGELDKYAQCVTQV
ncbi:CD2-associated protein-like isoform X2 [Teleopsis dalmanni]|uniref:CD2-associated protein-like isoform X2 n=1 Tax=Teleopsis dalmanni TaxID=139649 RepID=UPI0018CEC98F|nr:CD2-associated protein-like isoform X2 [Teleopsis dalmanni]